MVFTSFELIKDVCDSGKEVGISDYDVLLLKVSEGQKAQVTGKKKHCDTELSICYSFYKYFKNILSVL